MNRSTRGRTLAALAAIACLTLTACGGDDDASATPTSSDTTSSTTDATTTTTSPEEAEAEITEKTTEFFRLIGIGDREAAMPLLENGADYVDELIHCEDLVAGVTVAMKTVEVSGDTATTTYDILINGETVLEGSGGSAVRTDEGWLVGENTFLSLYDAAKDGCTGPPPAAS